METKRPGEKQRLLLSASAARDLSRVIRQARSTSGSDPIELLAPPPSTEPDVDLVKCGEVFQRCIDEHPPEGETFRRTFYFATLYYFDVLECAVEFCADIWLLEINDKPLVPGQFYHARRHGFKWGKWVWSTSQVGAWVAGFYPLAGTYLPLPLPHVPRIYFYPSAAAAIGGIALPAGVRPHDKYQVVNAGPYPIEFVPNSPTVPPDQRISTPGYNPAYPGSGTPVTLYPGQGTFLEPRNDPAYPNEPQWYVPNATTPPVITPTDGVPDYPAPQGTTQFDPVTGTAHIQTEDDGTGTGYGNDWQPLASTTGVEPVVEDTLTDPQYDDWEPTDGWAPQVRITTNVPAVSNYDVTLTGFAGGVNGQSFELINSKSSTGYIHIGNESFAALVGIGPATWSAAANRVVVGTKFWCSIPPGGSLQFKYDGDVSRWIAADDGIGATLSTGAPGVAGGNPPQYRASGALVHDPNYLYPGSGPGSATGVTGGLHIDEYCKGLQYFVGEPGAGTWKSVNTWFMDAAQETWGGTYNNKVLPVEPVVQVTTSSAVTITGFNRFPDGDTSNPTQRKINIVNLGPHTITIEHQNAGSDAPNRAVLPDGGSFTIPVGGGAILEYVPSEARWHPSTPVPERTGVTAGAYTAPTLTVNAYGAITAAADSPASAMPTLGSADQVLSVNSAGAGLEYRSVTAGSGISITPGSGTITIDNTSPGISSLTVREDDGSPSVAATEIDFGASEFTVTDSGGGVATVNSRPEFLGNILANRIFGF